MKKSRTSKSTPPSSGSHAPYAAKPSEHSSTSHWPTIHAMPGGGLRTNLPSHALAMVQEDGDCQLEYNSGRSGEHHSLDFHGHITPVMGDAAPPRYVAGNAFFNYQLFGGLRKGGSINFFSSAYRGYAIAAFLSGYVYVVVIYLLLRLPEQALGLEESEYVKNVLSLQWTIVVAVGILSDAYAPFGFRRKSFMIAGWILAALLWLSLFILFTVSSGPPPTAATVTLIVLAFLSLIVATNAMDIRIIELSQQEELQLRGRLLGSYEILRITGQFTMHSAIAAVVRPDARVPNIVHLPFKVEFVFLHLAVLCAVPLYGLVKHADESHHSSLPPAAAMMTQPTMTSEVIDPLQSAQSIHVVPPPPPISTLQRTRRAARELWNCTQQRVVWQLILFNCVLFFFGLFELSDVRRAVQFLSKESAMARTIRNCVGDTAFVATLVAWRRYGINASWRVVTSGALLFYISTWFTTSTLVIYGAVRSPWVQIVAYALRAPHRVLVLLAAFVPCIEIAPAGTEGTTYALLASYQTIVKLLASELGQVITRAWPAIQFDAGALKESERATENTLFYGLVVNCVWVLGALLGLLLLPQQKLDAQQLRVYGGYSKLPVLLLSVGFLAGFPYVAYLQISRMGV